MAYIQSRGITKCMPAKFILEVFSKPPLDFQPPPANQNSVAIARILADSKVASVVTSRDPTRQFLHKCRPKHPSRCEKKKSVTKKGFHDIFCKGGIPTWRIIPFNKWLITMVSKSPNWGCSPPITTFHFATVLGGLRIPSPKRIWPNDHRLSSIAEKWRVDPYIFRVHFPASYVSLLLNYTSFKYLNANNICVGWGGQSFSNESKSSVILHSKQSPFWESKCQDPKCNDNETRQTVNQTKKKKGLDHKKKQTTICNLSPFVSKKTRLGCV